MSALGKRTRVIPEFPVSELNEVYLPPIVYAACQQTGEEAVDELRQIYQRYYPESNVRNLGKRHLCTDLGSRFHLNVEPVVEDEIPTDYLDPISFEPLVDAYLTDDGHSYNGYTVKQLFETARRENRLVLSPITRQPLTVSFPNYGLRNAVRTWLERHGLNEHMGQESTDAKFLIQSNSVLNNQNENLDAEEKVQLLPANRDIEQNNMIERVAPAAAEAVQLQHAQGNQVRRRRRLTAAEMFARRWRQLNENWNYRFAVEQQNEIRRYFRLNEFPPGSIVWLPREALSLPQGVEEIELSPYAILFSTMIIEPWEVVSTEPFTVRRGRYTAALVGSPSDSILSTSRLLSTCQSLGEEVWSRCKATVSNFSQFLQSQLPPLRQQRQQQQLSNQLRKEIESINTALTAAEDIVRNHPIPYNL
jgi:hypothetical protein